MDISWGQLQRFKFIEQQLLWGRSLKARMHMEHFNISRYQAGRDIKKYIEICHENILPYAPADKCYKPTETFNPRFVTGHFQTSLH